MNQAMPPLHLGVIFPLKKRAQSGFDGLAEHAAAKHNMRVTFISLERPIAEQGAFDVILHKLSETFLGFTAGDPDATAHWDRVVAYRAAHPRVPFMDPVESLVPLQSRERMAEALAAVVAGDSEGVLALPRTLAATTLAAATAELSASSPSGTGTGPFPLIVKRDEACSSHASHVMAVVAGPAQWAALVAGGPFDSDEQVTIQQLVPHGGVLYKVYALGPDRPHVLLRPSLKDRWEDIGEPLVFDSQRIPKAFPESTNGSTMGSVQAAFLSATAEDRAETARRLDSDGIRAQLAALTKRIASTMNLTLFGFDAVYHAAERRLYLVDVNYFPSFQGVGGGYQDTLLGLVRARWEQSLARAENGSDHHPQQQEQEQQQHHITLPAMDHHHHEQQPKERVAAAATPSEHDHTTADPLCLVCHKAPIEYGGSVCRCPTLCKRCAMRQATGGKCKSCGVLFGDLKRVD
ncbi:hypothetical protein H9P43_006978 [Blastocladiella emersonii ATCC 22665]|nr:hypothetical protein H9P43_006970 [Blastocladiella emersonii ATCC 22665]KAI9175615.1 hypothetical protein H9P43_006978 [Blastocladiella emersonii ATCC 22665]